MIPGFLSQFLLLLSALNKNNTLHVVLPNLVDSDETVEDKILKHAMNSSESID